MTDKTKPRITPEWAGQAYCLEVIDDPRDSRAAFVDAVQMGLEVATSQIFVLSEQFASSDRQICSMLTGLAYHLLDVSAFVSQECPGDEARELIDGAVKDLDGMARAVWDRAHDAADCAIRLLRNGQEPAAIEVLEKFKARLPKHSEYRRNQEDAKDE